MAEHFDPFNDRLSRDIRNSLSTALIAELTGADPSAVEREASRWLAESPQQAYRDYIEKSRSRYREAVTRIAALGLCDPRGQAVMLWNHGLFFELHELLETIWCDTVGTERTALKGLIQAAGVYIHSQRGKPETAAKLAARARANLLRSKNHLNFIENLDDLIRALERPGKAPGLTLGIS